MNQPVGNIPKPTNIEAPVTPKVSGSASSESIQSVKDLKQAQAQGQNIPISEQQLVKAIERAIKAVEGTSTTLDFSIHQATKHIIVKVLDKDTGNVIREIPNEKSLDFLAKVWETAGAMVDERA
ncbi:flagellar biosynthesis protein FlaG [Paenibacillus pectinilyticus]|uniref:Flagellar biosynthesis protein FlaG n=1 Tax=Paenibacillus pectinilyticus TaxID=512399 RepID=A0A1C0ZYM3_9BACL|nr:flagellar protein FlaG [Paenibacillus pectinilyticus]OCT13215.1 flagellar biosynthesis protein FlaG [Paenibacillus pectinilyticus]